MHIPSTPSMVSVDLADETSSSTKPVKASQKQLGWPKSHQSKIGWIVLPAPRSRKWQISPWKGDEGIGEFPPFFCFYAVDPTLGWAISTNGLLRSALPLESVGCWTEPVERMSHGKSADEREEPLIKTHQTLKLAQTVFIIRNTGSTTRYRYNLNNATEPSPRTNGKITSASGKPDNPSIASIHVSSHSPFNFPAIEDRQESSGFSCEII
ncbi:predicted protein [Histoplasma capsulatum G186AR]|uniref:Uncharacterized protein n=1 Tax=Ajellomyces capsulatus (strain G186AR / H82 / ATCC MYA-2454 / RMSCC 2432) TaxID=447093 RepID=C0NMV9_AJECG|nr:uncharacterized protein HCBG_04086 [Histoplasma capsulatum G186AR]EEH07207.1 predicted protein [Histoplasma capsulatum G186AR]